MSTTFLIPLSNAPQTFPIDLGGTEYIITTKFNHSGSGGWMFDLQLSSTGAYLISSVPMVVGVDLLDAVQYLGIPGGLIVFTDADPAAVPTFDNLGTESNLYFVVA